MNTPQEANAGAGQTPEEPAGDLLGIGNLVRLNGNAPYLKTADPMPMLRPPDLIDPGENGVVVELRALGIRAVRFRRGTFLLEGSRLSPADPDPPAPR